MWKHEEKSNSWIHPIISLIYEISNEILTWTIGHEIPNPNYIQTNASGNLASIIV
jgi:hypothetical protein